MRYTPGTAVNCEELAILYMPPRPPWYANTRISIPICLVVVVTTFFAVAMVVIDAGGVRTGTIGGDPALALGNAEAVDFTFTYTDSDGTQSTGRFTVTDDGYATGTVSDAIGGAATVHTTPDGSAVWGDEAWWARRVPLLASHVNDQWVRPDDGTALPLDPAVEFTPSGLADLVRGIHDSGTIEDDVTSYLGVPVEAKTWQDWTLIVTEAHPAAVLSLSGPIDQSLFHTAAASRVTVEAIPALEDGSDAAPHPQEGASVGALTIEAPRAAPSAAAATTRETSTTTHTGSTDTDASTAPPRGEADIEPPPAIASFIKPLPRFTGTINATTCTTPTCTWSVSVANNGDGPGEVTVTASANPGMGSRTVSLGTIQPGGTASTGTLSFGNPAPTPRPGQTTSVTVNYSALIYSPQIAGSNADRFLDLIDRLGGYAVQPLLDQIMQQLDTGLKDPAVEAMHSMLDEDVPPEEVLTALDEAAQGDPARGQYSQMPLLQRLAGAGDRFQGWASIAQQLTTVSPIELPYYLPGLETAAQDLAHPAASTVTLTYQPGQAGAPATAVVVTEYPDHVRCNGIVTAGAEGLAAAIEHATSIATPAADNCVVTASVTIPRTVPLQGTSPRTLLEQMQASAPDLTGCTGDSGFDGATITNQVGQWSWTAPQICAASLEEVNREALEGLNTLPQSVRDALSKQDIVTLDAAGAVTAINWKDSGRNCRSNISNLPAEPVPTGSRADREGGPRALGGFGYLCAPLGVGEEPQVDPWDYPTAPPRTSSGAYVFARCHLVAKILGGKGGGDNLVTCHHSGTNLRMEAFEKQTEASVTTDSHLLYIAVPLYYGPSDDASYPSLGAIKLFAISKSFVLERVYVNSAAGDHWTEVFVEADLP